MNDAARTSAVAVRNFAAFLIAGNVLLFAIVLWLGEFQARMEGAVVGSFAGLRAALYLVDAAALLFVFLRKPLISLGVIAATSTAYLLVARDSVEAVSPGYLIVMFVVAYWDCVFLLVRILEHRRQLEAASGVAEPKGGES